MSRQSYPSPPSHQPPAGPGASAPYYGTGDSSESVAQVPDMKQIPNTDESRPETALRESLLANAANTAPMYMGHPAYHESDPQRTTSPERLAQGVLNASNGEDFQDGQPPKKRSKVSRACDECRRKKIRCDATYENLGQTCSSCTRTGTRCAFSRTPMKRGPSKGYIRELADRLQNLETQMSPGTPQQTVQEMQYATGYADDGQQIRYGEGHHPMMSSRPLETRRRTRSEADDGDSVRDPALMRSSDAWSDIPRAEASANAPPAHPHTPEMEDPHSSATYVHQNQTPANVRQGGRTGPRASSREMPAFPYDISATQSDATHMKWDETCIDEYYRHIHPTFPLLHHSKQTVGLVLSKCHSAICEAFWLALDCAVRSLPGSILPPSEDTASGTQIASEHVSRVSIEQRRNMVEHTIYVQILMLMAMAFDNTAPAALHGSSSAEWLGRAIGVAAQLNFDRAPPDLPYAEGELDVNARRRLWLILIILDSFNASGTSNRVQITDNGAPLVFEDRALLGDTTYHLARLSLINGHVCVLQKQAASLMAQYPPAVPFMSMTLIGEFHRFRETIGQYLLDEGSLVHLAFLHVRLLLLRMTSASKRHELLEVAKTIAIILESPAVSFTPLNHHFAALATVTLTELMQLQSTRAEAVQGLDHIQAALNSRPSLSSATGKSGWNSVIAASISKHRTSDNNNKADREEATAGLQHLADAASGRKPAGVESQEATSANELEREMKLSTRSGYLRELLEGLENDKHEQIHDQ